MATVITDHLEKVSAKDCIDKIVSSNDSPPASHSKIALSLPLPRLSYSREFLVKLKTHPKSKQRPACLDPIHLVSKSGSWDPEHWISYDAKRGSSSATTNAGSNKDEAAEKASAPVAWLFSLVFILV